MCGADRPPGEAPAYGAPLVTSGKKIYICLPDLVICLHDLIICGHNLINCGNEIINLWPQFNNLWEQDNYFVATV